MSRILTGQADSFVYLMLRKIANVKSRQKRVVDKSKRKL